MRIGTVQLHSGRTHSEITLLMGDQKPRFPDSLPAKELFNIMKTDSVLHARSIQFIIVKKKSKIEVLLKVKGMVKAHTSQRFRRQSLSRFP